MVKPRRWFGGKRHFPSLSISISVFTQISWYRNTFWETQRERQGWGNGKAAQNLSSSSLDPKVLKFWGCHHIAQDWGEKVPIWYILLKQYNNLKILTGQNKGWLYPTKTWKKTAKSEPQCMSHRVNVGNLCSFSVPISLAIRCGP